MNVLRTPDERFAALPGYPFAPPYLQGAGGLRMQLSTKDGATRWSRSACTASPPGPTANR
jgi:hypothetical protein